MAIKTSRKRRVEAIILDDVVRAKLNGCMEVHGKLKGFN